MKISEMRAASLHHERLAAIPCRVRMTMWLTALACVLVWPSSGFAQSSRQLWEAAFNGNLDRVKAAVAKGRDVNYRGKGGFTPLIAAARNGHLDVAQYLVEHAAEVNDHDNTQRKTALMDAASHAHADIVEYLLEHGASVDNRSVSGSTALHEAAYVGCFACVQSLVDHHADVHLKNQRDEIALQTAQRGAREAVRRGETKATPEDYEKVIAYLTAHGG